MLELQILGQGVFKNFRDIKYIKFKNLKFVINATFAILINKPLLFI